MSTSSSSASAPTGIPSWLALVREKVEDLSYGVVQIVVHDHRVTTIERTERTRMDPPPAPADGAHPPRARSRS